MTSSSAKVSPALVTSKPVHASDASASVQCTESAWTRWLRVPQFQMALCASGIYVFYMFYSYVQEKIALSKYGPDQEHFSSYFFILFVQCLVNAAVAAIGVRVMGREGTPVSRVRYGAVSLSYMLAMYLSNASLLFVSYPTQVLGKSCKMVPVMLMGVLISRKKYSLAEYASVLFITLGITAFQSSGSLELRFGAGEAMLLASLLLDGMTGSLQEGIIKNHRPSAHQIMLNMNLWSSAFCALVLLVSGEGWRSLQFVMRAPELLWDVLLFGVASALGQNFVFFTLRLFGALVLAAVTTTRKFFSILLSVFLFGHHLSSVQWGGVATVFAGLTLEIVHKQWRKPVAKSTK